MVGFSHTSSAADAQIKRKFNAPEQVETVFDAFGQYGIDAVMCLLDETQAFTQAILHYQERSGKKLIVIDTPILNVDDTPEARREAEARIKKSKELGATFCLPHHYCAEQLVNKNRRVIDRLPDYLDMIRRHGLIPGLSAHMPELIVYSDMNGYDVETYIQIYNCMGFLMQVEIESVHNIIMDAKKPVMTIKPMAAGRVTPFVGLTFAYATLRDCDMVTVGCFSTEEVHEDAAISFAAIERRTVSLTGRGSPAQSEIL